MVDLDDNKPRKENVTDFVVDKKNPYYSAIAGVLFNKDASELICFPRCYKSREYVVPTSVNQIGEGAFRENKYVKKVDLSKTGKTNDNPLKINVAAFKDCQSLETVIFPDYCTISAEAFWDCPNLKLDVDIDDKYLHYTPANK